MNAVVSDILLRGCRSTPLAGYLKSLGILRIVSEQSDHPARGYWSDGMFHIVTNLDLDRMLDFFLNEYVPTPIIAPWNAGSGFYFGEEKSSEKDPETGKKIKTGVRNQETAATKVVGALLSSSCSRLTGYREVITVVKDELANLNLESPPETESKAALLLRLRNILPDALVRWLDAAVVLTSSGPKYPPLLGTGANDGRLDFTSNFMQRISEVIDVQTGKPLGSSRTWLTGAVLGTTIRGLARDVAIGQFNPAAAGGANASAGFESESVVNPWDYILMVEGSLMFASSATRRMDVSDDFAAFSSPFTVRPVGSGYESAASSDVTPRPEMWVPLWHSPALSKEVASLMSEGRARVGKRTAENAVDFARAVATLGVDRGIDSFERYGFQVRNGLSYFALPLGRYDVKRRREAELLQDVDEWLANLRRRTSSDETPNSVASAFHRLDDAIIDMCRFGGGPLVKDVLLSLGQCEKALATSIRWSRESFVRPVPPLSQSWLSVTYDGSREYRLAASLVSVYSSIRSEGGGSAYCPVRSNLEPVTIGRARETGKPYASWLDNDSRDVAWLDGDLARSLNSIMTRRTMRMVQAGVGHYSDRGKVSANLSDIQAFIEGRTDDGRISELMWGLMLVDWSGPVEGLPVPDSEERNLPPAIYSLIKLCFSGSKPKSGEVPIVPEIHRRASVGDGRNASVLAARRLRASGVSAVVSDIDCAPHVARRAAAALMMPLAETDMSRIARVFLRLGEENE